MDVTPRQAGRCLLLAAALGAGGGCVEERVVSTSWGPIKPPAPAVSQGSFGATGGKAGKKDGYAIALDQVEGANHFQRAEARRVQLAAQSRAKPDDLWVSDEGSRSIVFYGHYTGPEDPAARQDLIRWRQLIKAGQVSAQAAMLSPVVVIPQGSNPELDLRRASGRAPFTLQVAAFESSLDGYRLKAEEAAASLRKQGYEAYYFHGPNRSMVTIGLFTDKDLVDTPQGQRYSPRVDQLRQRFPYNTVNGLQAPSPTPGSPAAPKPQASLLVRVP